MWSRGNEVVLDAREILAEIRFSRDSQAHEVREHLLGDVTERQIADVAPRVDLLHLGIGVDDRLAHRLDALVRTHRAFRHAGGARGIDEKCDVIWLGGSHSSFELPAGFAPAAVDDVRKWHDEITISGNAIHRDDVVDVD